MCLRWALLRSVLMMIKGTAYVFPWACLRERAIIPANVLSHETTLDKTGQYPAMA